MPTSPASSTDTISVLHDSHAHSGDHKSISSTHASGSAAAAPWAAQLSASFTAIADQLGAASQALALVPNPSTHPSSSSSADTPNHGTHAPALIDIADLAARLDNIEQTQATLIAQLENLKVSIGQHEPDVQVQSQSPAGPSLEDLDKRITELTDMFKLEQDRLYARLRNATATVYKTPIVALPTATGKPPPNFPATKGEFEHLTKERYEAMLKAYGQPIKGDTNAKRHALRVFVGLPD